MSQPANDEFSQHLSDEESNHEDASDTGVMIYGYGEWSHLPCVLDNEVWKKNSSCWKKRGKLEYLVMGPFQKIYMRRFHGMDDAKEIWEAIRTRRVRKGYDRFYSYILRIGKLMVLKYQLEDAIFIVEFRARRNSSWEAREELLTMDDGIVNWGEHTEAEETNHALMAISSSNEGPQNLKISCQVENSSELLLSNQMDSDGFLWIPLSTLLRLNQKVFNVKPNEMSKKEVEPSCVSHIKTPRQPLKDKETHKVNRKNWNDMMERELGEGYSFTKKKCFVCGSLSHLIKDCDYYEKKMAREAEVKRVVNTGNGVAKPVWTNANRVNHANKFVPRSVQLNAGRPKFNSVRPNINTGRTNINSVRPKVNTVRPRQPEHPLKNMVDRGIFDSGCSGHMTDALMKALQDDSWVQAMQEELLQFKLQQVWVLVDLPHGMKEYKQDWLAQAVHTGRVSDYDEVFALWQENSSY
ncbi:hypothetical protein Tco_1124220 [Tanacetum coccineum]|uniref:CCHC-type domain-containing protein n=1 Tax=Tanacetum coccineum TaxID=301880 RepID=A0ABQ5J793_9ASTR